MDQATAQRLLRQMFDQTAPHYVERIEPTFKPLAEGLVAFAAPKAGERVLDLGTGSGLAAVAAARHAKLVVGLDTSRAMLEQARAKLAAPGLERVSLVQGDMHAPGLADETFEVLMGAFSFNSTDPARVFEQAFRLLVPGGRLVLQEWGASDPLSELVWDALAEYAVDDPPTPLAALRAALDAPNAWDALEGIEDLTRALDGAGFQEVVARTESVAVPFPNSDAFLAYKLAWSSRQRELEAMPQAMQDLLHDELREALAPHCAEDGGLTWRPEVVRVRAIRPVG